MDVFCVGMYRSCSTWQYEIASELVETYYRGQRLGFLTGEQYAGKHGAADGQSAWRVLKSHDGHAAFATALADGGALALYAYRDLRDVAYSLMHKLRASFEEVVERRCFLDTCLANDRFWRAQPGVLCLRYESLTADLHRGVRVIAAHLRLALSEEECATLAAAYTLEANRQRTNALAARLRAEGCDLEDPRNALLCDPHTSLHWNHLREGRVGAWRDQASAQERRVLAGICGPWLVAQGYEADDRWAGARGAVPPDRDGLRRELVEAHHLLAAARAQIAEQQSQLAAAWAELAQAHSQLSATGAQLDEARAQLLPFRQLGPRGVAVARGLRALAHQYPRAAGIGRRALDFLTRRAS
jgi:hypothetical protein